MIKKCPFCGGEAKLLVNIRDFSSTSTDITVLVRCRKCGIKTFIVDRCNPVMECVPYDHIAALAEQLAAMWNKRSDEA
mgnify:CR=1 FL=1